MNPFVSAWRALGISAGDLLLVEAPRLDPLPADSARLIAALQDVVGEAGTLVMPTCTHQQGRPKPTFDPRLSPSESGPLSESFRQQPGVLRSHSPTHSVAARGPAAGDVTSGHRSAFGRPTPWGEGSFGFKSPWDDLVQRNAWWALIDADLDESQLIPYLQAVYAERHSGITKETPFPQFDGHAVAEILAESDLLVRGTWNSHPLVAFRTGDAVARILQTLEQEPQRVAPGESFRNWRRCIDDIGQRGYLQAGTAKVTITPPVPCRRWDGKVLSGLYRDLHARILVLRRGPASLVLVTCDLLGLAKYLTDRIRAGVQARTGIPPDAVLIACTHAHSTPDTVGSGNADDRYLDTLVDTIVDGIAQAAAAPQPVRLGWTRIPIRGLAQSRRIQMKDGRVFTTRYGVPSTWRVDPDLIARHGVMDPDLTVIRVEDLQGQVVAAISHFGCHPSVALMSPNVSGDYTGEALHTLEQALGNSAVALFANGTAADIDPTLEMPFWGPRTDANALRLGRILAAQILESLERVPVSDQAEIAARRREVDLPVRADWIRLVESEQEHLKQEFASVSTENPVITPILKNHAVHTEVQVLRMNDLLLAGLPGETFTTTGLKIKDATPGGKVCVIEIANDYAGYLLTPEAAQEGGYEAGLHFYTRVRPEAEQILLDAVADLVHGLG